MQRRHVLRAAGAASALALPDLATGEQAAAGEGVGRQARTGECSLPRCIHPVVGYTGSSFEELVNLPADVFPDHVVELVTRSREGAGGPLQADVRPDPESYFEPAGLAVEPGDVVEFRLASPQHTVTAYHPDLGRQRRVPEGVPPFSSPVLGGETFWLYRFEEPGVYDLHCGPRELYGMAMRVVVVEGDAEPQAAFGEATAPDRRPPEGTAALVLDDDALAPEAIVEQGTVGWDELTIASKQLLVEFREPLAGLVARFEGAATDVTEPVALDPGLLVVTYEHEGREELVARLVDTAGEEGTHLIAREFDVTPSVTTLTIEGGEYVLDVAAGGPWTIELAQPRAEEGDAEELPVTVEGEAADFVGPLPFDGLVRASATHDGNRDFVVKALAADGTTGAGSLFDESGRFQGETTFTYEGLGWIAVTADGEWTLSFEYVQ